MGGFGSGRYGGKHMAEHLQSLDVNQLYRDGCLDAGFCGGRAWSRNGEQTASIGLRCDEECLTLFYRYQPNGGDWEDVEEQVLIERTPCHYGGTRPWFLCPGIVNGRPCYRRVGTLFFAGRYFLCRHCQNVAYASQSETPLDRTHRRRDKLLRDAFGEQTGYYGGIPPRPKGMWYRTYTRKLDAIGEADAAAAQAFGAAASKLLARLQQR